MTRDYPSVLSQTASLDVRTYTPTVDPTNPSHSIVMSKRDHALRELLASERAYASALAFTRDIHIPLARGERDLFNIDQATGPMTPEDVHIIFGNIVELAMFSDMFAERLEDALGSALDGGTGEDGVGALFLQNMSALEPPYNTYIACYPTALARFYALPSSPALSAYISDIQTLASSLTYSRDLPSFLVMPVQRLLKYPLLLDAIIDATPNHHHDLWALVEARERLVDVARCVNLNAPRPHLIIM